MRKAIVGKTDDLVKNIVVVPEPMVLKAECVRRVTRAARAEKRWWNKATRQFVVKPALEEESRGLFYAPSHGLKPTSGPFTVKGKRPAQVKTRAYFIKVIDDDYFLLMDDVDGQPIEITGGGKVTLTEVGWHPGPDFDVVDDADDHGEIGLKYDRANGKFVAPNDN